MNQLAFRIQDETYRVDAANLAAPGAGNPVGPQDLHRAAGPRRGRRRVAGGTLLAKHPRARLLVDGKVRALHLAGVAVDPGGRVLELTASEAVKSPAGGVIPVLDWLAEAGLTQTNTLVVVGGGIVQDVGGFAAHLFKRGLPSTFFHHAAVAVRQLHRRQGRREPRQVQEPAGALRGAAPGGDRPRLPGHAGAPLDLALRPGRNPQAPPHRRALFADRFAAAFDAAGGGLPSLQALRALTWDSLVVKRAVIERDEFELDQRRALNYGHTIGHAIENLSGFAIPHGQAIGLGMAIVNRVAANRGMIEAGRPHTPGAGVIDLIVDDRCRAALGALDLGQLREALSRDKKNTGSTLNLVVMTEVGRLAFLGVENNERFAGELREIVQSMAERSNGAPALEKGTA